MNMAPQLPDPSDLAMLLAMSPTERLGAIIRLNRGARYSNRLNVITVLSLLEEWSSRRMRREQRT